MRFCIIDVGLAGATEPSGQPATARMCCSNWLATARLDGPVAGIVDPRGDLVDEEPVAGLVLDDEELDRQHADIIERPSAMRRHAHEPPAAVSALSVAGRRVKARMWSRCSFSQTSKAATSPSPARGRDHGNLAHERNERLENGRPPADAGPCRARGRRRPRSSPGPCRHSRSRRVFSTAGRPTAATASSSISGRRPGRKSGVARPRSRTKRFSVSRSCVTARARGPGSTGTRADRQRRRGGRHVLELVGDDVRPRPRRRPARHRRHMPPACAHRHLEGAAAAFGRKDVALQAKWCGGERQHAAELPAAEDADACRRAAARSGASRAWGATATLSLLPSVRRASSRSVSAGSERPAPRRPAAPR